MGQRSILILGDASSIDRELQTALGKNGFGITDTLNVKSAIDLIHSTKFDLLLLNFDLPAAAGIRACRKIRAHSDMGIILLAESTAERDKVDALLSGVDDYVTKPFNMTELLARMRAVLRRSSILSNSKFSRINLNDLEVDFETRRVRVLDRRERLTPKELEVLFYLANRANKTVRHRELLQAIWGPDYGSTEHCLRGCIGRLRKKIEVSPEQPKYLETVPWVGYRLLLPK